MPRISSSAAGWLAIAMAATAVLAQTAGPPSASLAGTVTNSVTGEPVLRAHVVLRCMVDGNQQTYGALTNGEGKFSVANLSPGNYMLSVDRVGFVAPLSSANYELTSGTQKEGVKLTLTPTGAITGRVLDVAGEPVPGASVVAEGPGGNGMGATTDDMGQFRLGGLRAGKYRVKATPQTMPLPPEIRSDGSPDFHDAATYYPDSLTAQSAQRLEVRPAAEVSAIAIRLLRMPIVTVSGKVTGLPPEYKNAMITAYPAGLGSVVKMDGSFALWRLNPGKYTLTAASFGQNAQSRLQSAPLDIEVTTVNLEHLELRMIPPFDIPGQMRFEDEQSRQPAQAPSRPGATTPAPPPSEPRRLLLRSMQRENGQTVDAAIGADDSFTLEKVQPGRYRMTIGWGSGYVKSARAGATETEGDILDVRNGSAGPLVVLVSSNTCEVSGTVSDSKGPVADATVMLAPAEEPSNVRTGSTDSGGIYKFSGLAPGKYTLVPMDEGAMVWGISSQNQNLEEYADVAGSIELNAGDKASKDLKRHN